MNVRTAFRMRGVGRAVRELSAVQRAAPAAFGRALHFETRRIMGDSRRRVPVDSGELRDSGYVNKPRVTRRRAAVELGYNASHAAAVHELPGEGRKYLEGALLAASGDFGDRLARHVRRDLFDGRGPGSAVVVGALLRDAGRLVRRAADEVTK